MLNIVKHHIDRNFYLFLPILIVFTLGFSFESFADEQSSVTPIQLKVLQTRKFSKSPEEVVEAISTNCEDLGGTAQVAAPQSRNSSGKGICLMQQKSRGISPLNFVPIIGSIAALSDLNKMYKNIGQIKYEVRTNADRSETTVRIRMYSLQEGQVTDPEVYSTHFKKIADSLFIQAIEIDPALQE